jgi:hypothetical protein
MEPSNRISSFQEINGKELLDVFSDIPRKVCLDFEHISYDWLRKNMFNVSIYSRSRIFYPEFSIILSSYCQTKNIKHVLAIDAISIGPTNFAYVFDGTYESFNSISNSSFAIISYLVFDFNFSFCILMARDCVDILAGNEEFLSKFRSLNLLEINTTDDSEEKQRLIKDYTDFLY